MYSDDAHAVIICGDLNGMIGNVDDNIPSINNIPERKNFDTVFNQHWHSLIEFPQEAKNCVINGRVSPENDGYTCSTARGVSVVDYFLVPHDLIGNCQNFSVTSMNESPDNYQNTYDGVIPKAQDHALLNFELRINVVPTISHIWARAF